MRSAPKNGTSPDLPEVPRPADDTLGIDALDTQLALQTDVCKEMVNKIAWVLGSTYRRPYSNMKNPARSYAWRIVKQVIKDHGYPDKIGK